MTHHRNMMSLTPPPPELKSPIGRWWCAECNDWATGCAAKDQHQWVIAWREWEGEE